MSDPFQKPDALYDLLSTCLRDANERGDRLSAENTALRAEVERLKIYRIQAEEVSEHYEIEIAKLKAERDAYEEAADNAELFQFVFRKGDKP